MFLNKNEAYFSMISMIELSSFMARTTRSLISFAPLAFVSQCQCRPRVLSPLVFFPISNSHCISPYLEIKLDVGKMHDRNCKFWQLYSRVGGDFVIEWNKLVDIIHNIHLRKGDDRVSLRMGKVKALPLFNCIAIKFGQSKTILLTHYI
jgi:hypothetical protein